MATSQTPPSGQRFLVCSGMRDEGPFLIEWLVWYRMLGFEALVVTNDCTDHSAELLEHLDNAGWVVHQAHVPAPGQPPKVSAYNTMRTHPLMAEVDWVLVCDVDEFLVLHDADTVSEYLASFDEPPLGFGFHWRTFGTARQTDWNDGLVHRTFHRAAETKSLANSFFKSMFRRPLDFAAFSDHSPVEYFGPWPLADHVWVDGNGKRLGRMKPDARPQKATAADRVRHERAQMNHYMLRAEESFDLKRGTLSASAGLDRYNDRFYDKFNRNECHDETALRFRKRFDDLYAEAMSIAGVHGLHHLCCADYVARLAEHKGIRPADDERWGQHMKAAESRQS